MKIDLSKPLQWSPDGHTWLDVTCSPKLHDGTVYLQVGSGTTLWVTNPETSDSLRNKPEPVTRHIRPYTFDEVKRFVGTPVIGRGDGLWLICAAGCDDAAAHACIWLFNDDNPTPTWIAAKRYKHPDGSPFGVVELA